MMDMPDRTLTDEEWEAVRNTLDILQEAQHLTEHASQVPGFADEWSELAVVWEAVKKGWHLVESRRMQVRQYEKTGLESPQDSTNPISVYTPISC